MSVQTYWRHYCLISRTQTYSFGTLPALSKPNNNQAENETKSQVNLASLGCPDLLAALLASSIERKLAYLLSVPRPTWEIDNHDDSGPQTTPSQGHHTSVIYSTQVLLINRINININKNHLYLSNNQQKEVDIVNSL